MSSWKIFTKNQIKKIRKLNKVQKSSKIFRRHEKTGIEDFLKFSVFKIKLKLQKCEKIFLRSEKTPQH